jgi:SAM-dependent methyltransferase
MESEEYRTIFTVEDQHWWYVGMQSITTTLIARLYPHRTDLHILEAGCGTGAAMSYLGPFGPVTGCDLSGLALQFCRQRGLRSLNQASVLHLPFDSSCFDLVTSFDVLYHRAVDDYGQALGEFGRVLKSGGYLLLRLPAYDWLRGRHDQVIHTARRFTTTELGRSLAASGFSIEKLSYANTLLFPLALAKRLLERVWPSENSHSDIHPNPAWQDKLLAQFLFAEARWLARRNLPFGLTVIAIGRKP